MVTYIKNNNVFFVNLKCGYSTFEKMRRKNLIKYYHGDLHNKTVYIIARDPYKRLESFYNDKLVKHMNPDLNQICQQRFLDHFSRNQLINRMVTFEQFIHAVGDGYNDEHIALQCNVIRRQPNYIVYLEHGLSALTEILGVNPDLYIDNTSINNHEQYFEWTTEMRTIINKLYATDFIKLGYSML